MADYDTLIERLRTAKAQHLRVHLWTNLWMGLLILIGGLTALGGLDLIVPLPRALRLTLLGAIVFGALAGLIVLVVRHRRRSISDLDAALLVERHYPDLEDRLVSAVPFGNKAPEGVSGYLVEKAVTEARKRLLTLGRLSVVDRTRLYRCFAAGFGGLVLVGFLILRYPAFFGAEMARVLTPWRDLPPLQWTQIAVSPGNVELLQGSDQTLKARISGRSVASAEIHLRPPGGVWKKVPMEPLKENRFAYKLLGLHEDVEYRVTAGDARSDRYRISVYTAPELRDVSVTYTYPAYTGLPAMVQKGAGNIEAVIGTKAEVVAQFSKPLASAVLCMGTEAMLRAERVSDVRVLGRFEVVVSTSYHFRVQDREGYGNDPPQVFAIQAVRDRPPDVKIPEPGGDVWVTLVDMEKVSVEAEDDFGVRDLTFNISINGGAEQRLGMGTFDFPGVRRASRSHTFRLRETDIAPGDVIAYYAEATDWSDPREEQRGRSDLYVLAVRPLKRELVRGGARQGAYQQLSERQMALLQDTRRVVQKEGLRKGRDALGEEAEALAVQQRELREDLERFLASLKLSGVPQEQATSAAMKQAESMLRRRAPQSALPPEQEALAGLMKLEMRLPENLYRSWLRWSGGVAHSPSSSDDSVPIRRDNVPPWEGCVLHIFPSSY